MILFVGQVARNAMGREAFQELDYSAVFGTMAKWVVQIDDPARVAELITKGNCISCHGDGFSKPIDPAYPKIAGQHADYLYSALKSYKTENQQYVGRSNGVMAGVAKQFSNAELKALANYIGSIEGDLKVVPESRFR